ncbi:MAG: single-stranded DNA-binding protein [Ignavibacteria bacterium]
MAKDLNKVILIGRLGQDPELKYTQSGLAVAKFTLATGQQWKDQDGNTQDRTEWHSITAWRRLAEICSEYLKKGSKVYLEGSLSTSSWEDENKKKHYRTEIVLNDMIMLDAKGTGSSSGEAASDNVSTLDSKEDDLPF